MIPSAPMMIVTSPIVAEKQDDGTDGSTWFVVSGSHGHQYETLVIRLNHRLYRIADERIWTDGNANEKGYYFNDYVDRDDGVDGDACHDIDLSPDKRWLFVSREFYHGLGVSYLFHFTGKGFVRVHPQGWRFDEAALRYFGRKLHFSMHGLDVPAEQSGGTRFVELDYWTPNSRGFVFNLVECGFTRRQADEKFITIKGYYDVHSRRFKALKVEDDRRSTDGHEPE